MQHVLVIGGGVIGLTSAWWLLEAGFGVTLLEREVQVGNGASYANGGQLSYRYVSPLADAGVPLKALHWMFQQDAPLRFRPELDLRQWRWLASFLAHCNAAANSATTAHLLELGEASRQAMAELAIPQEEFSWREAGKLIIYRSRPALDVAVARPDAGQLLSPAQCVRCEPALAHVEAALAGGIFNPGEAVADCHAFCEALMRRIAQHPRFQARVTGAAHQLERARGKVTGVATAAGRLVADHYVLAAGIASRDLAATADIRLPLYPVKGYSLTAPIRSGDLAPQVSVTDFERKILYARIGERLRVAAMADLVGENLTLDAARVQGLLRQVRATMPQAADYAQLATWAGLRPSTPSGAPLIGASRYANLWLNVGHGPLGFTFACGAARKLAAIMHD
ncbi:D-amino acid dehydrogenase [Massilia sp. CF038]|uniref:D-amino acid dehydrogenase n=1 Tax=Massilia sp. CF038 TaxID=1881045 RepID=UPI000920EBA8|nr:D-amino acid dehydrogenase [Massilia sp. CF038]SHH46839.1 D-amino-acid dehydrogenase [Massilia sp. CF038]